MPATWVETREVPLAKLQRYPGNARRGDTASIAASLRRNGQYRSLIVRDHDGQYTILAGNNTADALEAENREVARCEIITCTDQEAARINLADNRLAELGDYDQGALLALLTAAEDDLTGTGYEVDDLDDLRALLGDTPTIAPGETDAAWAETEQEQAEREARVGSGVLRPAARAPGPREAAGSAQRLVRADHQPVPGAALRACRGVAARARPASGTRHGRTQQRAERRIGSAG